MAQESGKRGESGSPFCPVTRWLYQATGQAYKLLTVQRRCQSKDQRLAAILGTLQRAVLT